MTGRVRSQGGLPGIADRTTSLFLKPICFISHDTQLREEVVDLAFFQIQK